MSSLNDQSTTFSQKEDIRGALDEIDKPASKPVDEDGADKINLKSQRDADKEKEDEDEEVEVDGEKRTKKSIKEEEDLKKKLGVDEEEDEVEEDLIAPVRFKEVLKAFPEIDKKFPWVKAAYYRDQQFTEQFSTPQEAKEARETLQEFDGFRQQLLNGNMTEVLKTVKEANPNSFARLVDNTLTAIGAVDQQAYFHILGNQTIATIQAMNQMARSTNNQDLLTAANILQQFVFGHVNQGLQTQPFAKQSFQQQDPNQQLELERRKFAEERFESFASDVDNKVGNQLKALIETNIDPQNQMTAYVKAKAIDDCFNALSERMQADDNYNQQRTKAWERAVKSNLNQESLNMVRTIAINKGKQLLSQIILNVRNEALKGLGVTKRESTREPITPGRSTSSSNSGKNKLPAKPAGMSTRDYFDLED